MKVGARGVIAATSETSARAENKFAGIVDDTFAIDPLEMAFCIYLQYGYGMTSMTGPERVGKAGHGFEGNGLAGM